MDLAGDGHNIIERRDDDEAAGQGDLAAQAGALGSDRLFQDLNEYMRLAIQHFIDLAGLDDLRLRMEISEIEPVRAIIVHGRLRKFQQGASVWAQIRIVKKGVFLKTDV